MKNADRDCRLGCKQSFEEYHWIREREDEAHVAGITSGTQIIFRSSWCHQWPVGMTEVYILDLRSLV